MTAARRRGDSREVYTVRVEDGFSAAHFLAHYHGKCEKLHGHNYKVRVTAGGAGLGQDGMLVDFSILKAALKKIISPLDHANLNELPAFKDGSPSAERIAKFVFDGMRGELPATKITLVEVFETESNRAAYSPD